MISHLRVLIWKLVDYSVVLGYIRLRPKIWIITSCELMTSHECFIRFFKKIRPGHVWRASKAKAKFFQFPVWEVDVGLAKSWRKKCCFSSERKLKGRQNWLKQIVVMAFGRMNWNRSNKTHSVIKTTAILRSISSTFYVKLLCAKNSNAQKDTDNLTEFLHFWDL